MSDAPESIYIGEDDIWGSCAICSDGRQILAHDHNYPDCIEYIRADLHDPQQFNIAYAKQAERIVELEQHVEILKEQAACTYLHQAGIACMKCGWFSAPQTGDRE